MAHFPLSVIKGVKGGWVRGQLMLLSVMLLSAILSIALFLTVSFVSNMRQARLIMDSVKAFYAADSGIELSLFRYFKNSAEPDVQMANGTWCCSLTVTTPQSLFGDLRVTSSGSSPSASSTDRLTRLIEIQGY